MSYENRAAPSRFTHARVRCVLSMSMTMPTLLRWPILIRTKKDDSTTAHLKGGSVPPNGRVPIVLSHNFSLGLARMVRVWRRWLSTGPGRGGRHADDNYVVGVYGILYFILARDHGTRTAGR